MGGDRLLIDWMDLPFLEVLGVKSVVLVAFGLCCFRLEC